ncbi:MAG: multidrug effflux MFS transporter [Desulfobacterales bacterium]
MKLLPLLALLAAFPPLSTDMYLPAIPSLQARWQVSLVMVNYTLVGFFLSFSLALLIYGPLSDRFGRRPPLLGGIGVYIISSVLCATADQVNTLILFRVLQGMGAASAAALSMAISKDCFDGRERDKMLAYMGVIVALAPMMAPVLGGLMLKWLAWPWIFISQGILGLIAFLGVWRMSEPSQMLKRVPTAKMIGRYLFLFRNQRYIILTFMMALGIWPLFGFIAGSADIYIRRFGLSEQVFSYFFACNAIAFMSGSYTCARLVHRVQGIHLMTAGFAGIFLGGWSMLFFGGKSPWSFAVSMAFITFCMGLSRPLGNSLILEQVDTDTGSASSMLMFVYFVMGAGGMWMISHPWADKPFVLGVMAVSTSAAVLLSFHFLYAGKGKS